MALDDKTLAELAKEHDPDTLAQLVAHLQLSEVRDKRDISAAKRMHRAARTESKYIGTGLELNAAAQAELRRCGNETGSSPTRRNRRSGCPAVRAAG